MPCHLTFCVDVLAVPGLSAIQSHPGTEVMLSSLVKEMERVNVSRLGHVFEADMVSESIEQLRQLSACYGTSYEVAQSDSEDET